MRLRVAPLTAWNRFWFAPGPAIRLGLARAIFCGSAFFFYLPQDFTEWGTAAPVFWMPIWLFETFRIPVLPSDVLGMLQAIWKASLALCALGLWTRTSAFVAAVLGTYLLGLPHNFGATQHFDTLVVFAFGILAMSRAGDARSLDSLLRTPGRRPTPRFGAEYTWPIRAMWVVTALVFFGAGTSKLRHSGLEWVLSDNLQLLLMRAYYHVSDGDPLTSLGLVIAQHPVAARVFAATALAIETLYVVALFSRHLRPFIGAAGIALLVGIRALMGPTFEPYLICALFCVPWHRVEALLLRLVASSSPAPEIAAPRRAAPASAPPQPSIAFRSLL